MTKRKKCILLSFALIIRIYLICINGNTTDDLRININIALDLIFLSIESNHNTYTRTHSKRKKKPLKFIFHSLLNYDRNPINHYYISSLSLLLFSMTYAHLFCFSNNISRIDSPSKKISLTKCQKVLSFR